MLLKDQIKNFARKALEAKPNRDALARMLRKPKPLTAMFSDDGIVPNHPRWPLVVYRNVIRFGGRGLDPATVMDALFGENGWGRSWRDTIYDFVHYHSQVHEVLGVARGNAQVEFGGVKGRTLALKAGDVAILPAGTGHRLIETSQKFPCRRRISAGRYI